MSHNPMDRATITIGNRYMVTIAPVPGNSAGERVSGRKRVVVVPQGRSCIYLPLGLWVVLCR